MIKNMLRQREDHAPYLGRGTLMPQVYAIDLLGFGASDKAAVEYSMELWRDQVGLGFKLRVQALALVSPIWDRCEALIMEHHEIMYGLVHVPNSRYSG